MKRMFGLLMLILVLVLSCTAAYAEKIEPEYCVDMEGDLGNCIFPASFELTDVSDHDIAFNVYSDLCYNINDVAKMKEGDTIVTDLGDITVKTLEMDEDLVIINFDQKDSASLFNPEDTNGWVLMGDEGYPVMQLLGQAQMELAENVTVTRIVMDENDEIIYESEEVSAAELNGKLYEEAANLYAGFEPDWISLRTEDARVAEVIINYC